MFNFSAILYGFSYQVLKLQVELLNSASVAWKEA